VFRTLREPRYATLGALMVVVAIACVLAGTWQIARYEDKHHANDHLRVNAHRPTVGVAAVLPLVGSGRAPSEDDVEFRTVRATGTYDASGQSLVRGRTVDGDTVGFLILTPFRTGGATLLVVRGFLAQSNSGAVPVPASPPTGRVTVVARTQSPESRNDAAAQLTRHQVESINPRQQARRLGTPVYDGYAELDAGQPGTAGLTAIPKPDLSNPAGGALEPQHFAYVIQWYLFAILALAAPFAMARADRRNARRDAEVDFDAAPPAVETISEPTEGELRARKIADRYGRSVH
jgi:cytochrome oxidase assembly protein ShyY1